MSPLNSADLALSGCSGCQWLCADERACEINSGLQQCSALAKHVLVQSQRAANDTAAHIPSQRCAKPLQPHCPRTPCTDVPRRAQCSMRSHHCLPVHMIKRIAQLYCAELDAVLFAHEHAHHVHTRWYHLAVYRMLLDGHSVRHRSRWTARS